MDGAGQFLVDPEDRPGVAGRVDRQVIGERGAAVRCVGTVTAGSPSRVGDARSFPILNGLYPV